MSSWTIYSKNGVAKYTVKELEFHDVWMGEEYVMVNITSPTPLDIEIGDYLMYRGLTYSVYSVPGALKQARRGSYGEAFKYDNVKLSSRGTELTDIRFLDYVLEDNNIHYTSLPTFSFHCMTVDDLLDRLQANTDRDGGNQWYFISPSYSRTMQRYQPGTAAYTEAARLWEEHFGGDHGVEPNYERTDVNISIDKQSVWDGLIHIKNDFNLNFIMRERAVIVGGEGISAEHVFRYGKGNGLYQIERVADQDQKVTTKLFAYGSDKNLPIRYYANVTRICFAKMYARPSVDSNILYLDFVWNRSYVTGAADSDGKFPVVVSINGTTYQVKAYPMEVGARTLFSIEATTSLGFVTTSMDIIFVSGIDKDKFPASNVRQESGALPNNMAVQVLMLPGFPQYALSELCRSTISGGYTIFEIRKTPSSAYNEFMRIEGNHPVTFSDDPLQPFIISGNADTLGIKEGDVHYTEENDDNGLKEIYPSIEGMTRGDVEGTSSEERLDEIVSCDVIQDNGVFAEGVEIQNFNLVLKDIGFDLKQAFDNAGGNMTISMKDGYCGGRDFNVHSVNANSNGTWTLNVERSHDDGLDLYFPYSTNAAIGQTPTADEPYQIRTGDHFVLTEIEIGDTSYIWAAAMKMLRKSITYLLNNDYTRFTYLPKVDELYMARQHDESQTQAGTESLHDTLKSGMLMLFDDEDLGVDGSVFIDSVTIKENGNNGIPTYDVVLRNDKQVGTMQRIQNQIQSLTSYVSGGGGGLSVAQIRSLINAYGAGLFLSKLNDDAAQGVITFIRGLISQAYTQFGAGADFGQFVQGLVGGDGARIDEHGNMEATSLVLRSFLEAPKLVYNHVDVRVGDEWQSNGAGEIESVEIDQNNPLQGTIKLHLLDGEYGTIKPQDKCKGIFHHLEGYNDTETKDDGKGGRTFAGFYTSYFIALSVSGDNNEYIHYELRPTIDVGGNTYWQNDQGTSSGIRGGFHPSAHMVFAQYSNAADSTRQSCQYRTTTYTRMLTGMTGWDEGLANVAFQIGNTPLIASAYDIPDAGRYSLWINGDIYFAGTLNRIDSWGRDVADYPDQGNYFSTIQYHLNDLVHYDGSVWRMAIENEATLGVTPGTSTVIEGQTVYPWVKWIYADSMNPSGKWNHTLVPYAANSIVNIEGMLLISKRSTSQPPIDLLTDENSEPLQTETGEYIVYSDEVNDDWELLFDVGDLTNGKDGQNAIVVNLTNDTDTVLSDEQGNVIGDLPTTTAQLYDGVTLITSGVSWTCQTVGCTATINPQGVVSITAMSADEAKVACIATYNTKTYTKVFTFKKLYGKDKLWLEPSVDKIERYVSGISDNQRSYAYAPTSIRFKAYIQKSGQEPRELTTSDGYILLGTNTTHYASGQEINVASIASLFVGNHLPVLLKDASGNTQDVEDIVVTEAQDSITSAGAWTYERQIRNNELVSLFGNVYRAKQDSKGVSPVELLTNENNVPLQDENGEYIAYNFNTNTTYYELWIKGSYVIRTEVMYAKGTDGTTTPASGWSFTKPSVTYGDWLWIRTEVIRSDENNSVSYSVSYVGTNGIDGKDGENAVQLALAVSPDAIALNAEGNFKTGSTLTVKIQKTDGSVTTNIQKSGTATFKLWVGSNGYDISDYNSSTESYSISLTGKNIQSDSYVHVTYVDGDINLDKSVSVTQDGSQGLQGCVTRVSEWKAGVTYKHDTGLALGYIDVVGVRNSSASDGTGWDFYECKTEHTASTSNQPPNATYWTKLNNLGATYTSLLIADNAFIRFGTGNELRIVGDNDKIQAGMRGGTENADGVRIWAGNIYDGNNNIDLNLAPFRVLQNGKLYATDAYIEGEIHATKGEFTGTITAKSGGITGNFKIGENKAHQYYFEFKPKERAGGTGDYNYYSAQLNGYDADNNKEVFSIKMGVLSAIGPTTIGYAPVITMEDSFINPYHFHFEYTIKSRPHVTENIMIGGESYMHHQAYKNNVSKTFMSGIINGVGTIVAQSGNGENGWATEESQVPIGGVYRRYVYDRWNDTYYYVLCVRVS